MIEANRRAADLLPKMAARFGTMIPVPGESIFCLNNGDLFDLGNNQKLKIIFTPGHQPSGIVILEQKNNGLFINDLVGEYLQDADDFFLVLTSSNTDVIDSMKSIQQLMELNLTRLFLRHFGIVDQPKKIMKRALDGMQKLMDIGAECIKAGKPDDIITKVLAHKMIEMKKLRLSEERKDLYKYVRDELNTHHAEVFSKYYLSLKKCD